MLVVVSIRAVEDGAPDFGVLVDVPVAFAHPPTTRVPASMSVPTFRRRNAAPPDDYRPDATRLERETPCGLRFLFRRRSPRVASVRKRRSGTGWLVDPGALSNKRRCRTHRSSLLTLPSESVAIALVVGSPLSPSTRRVAIGRGMDDRNSSPHASTQERRLAVVDDLAPPWGTEASRLVGATAHSLVTSQMGGSACKYRQQPPTEQLVRGRFSAVWFHYL